MSDALKGLKVEHDASTFKEGRDTTLIIKDTGMDGGREGGRGGREGGSQSQGV